MALRFIEHVQDRPSEQHTTLPDEKLGVASCCRHPVQYQVEQRVGGEVGGEGRGGEGRGDAPLSMMSPMSMTLALRTSEKADGMIGRDSDCGSIFPSLD